MHFLQENQELGMLEGARRQLLPKLPSYPINLFDIFVDFICD